MVAKKPLANDKWYAQALQVFVSVSGWIAGPIIGALFLGKWLDKKYDSEPWLFLACIGLAFAISSFGIVKITLAYIKKIEKEAQDKKEKHDSN